VETHENRAKVVETGDSHAKAAEIDENRAKVVEIALPVRKGLVPPPRRPYAPVIPTAAIAPPVPPKISRIEPKAYALKELGGRIFLPVQEDRNESSRILGTIPFFATDVEALGECIDDWCLIRRGALQGWIRYRNLTDEPRIANPRLQLEAIMPVDALNVYSAPNKAAVLVAKIEPPVTDIKPLENCDEQWCYIRHFDVVGWVEPRYLTRQ
jgi:SH3-like domain-containing protein